MSPKSSPDRRIQRTRQLLQNSLVDLILEKNYDSITKQNIIDRANVGRSTFYFHFRDKDDLLLSGFDKFYDVIDDFRNEPFSEEYGWVFCLAPFEHAEENRRILKALFRTQTGNMLIQHVQKQLTALVTEHFQEKWPVKNLAITFEIFVQYLVRTLIGLFSWWLDNDISYSAQQMTMYYQNLIKPTIEANIRV